MRSQERVTAHARELAPPTSCVKNEMAEPKSVKLSELSLQQLDRFKAQLNEVSELSGTPYEALHKT